MSQQEIINILSRSPRPLSVSELSEKCHINKQTISKSCKILFDNDEVEIVLLPHIRAVRNHGEKRITKRKINYYKLK